MRLYIGNLCQSVTQEDIKAVFKSYNVKDCCINEGGRKNFAIVNVEHGAKAIKDLDGSVVRGKPLKVMQAVDRTKQCVNG